MSGRPHRLAGFSYRGRHRYSLTFCTHKRRRVFVDADVVEASLDQILQTTGVHHFAILAYCFMPDHLHLLVDGQCDDSDLIAFAHDVKQKTAYAYMRHHTGRVWQKGFYDHIVRNDEASLTVARYILENPVRGGLTTEPRDYPFSGSSVWDWDQLYDMWQLDESVVETLEDSGTP